MISLLLATALIYVRSVQSEYMAMKFFDDVHNCTGDFFAMLAYPLASCVRNFEIQFGTTYQIHMYDTNTSMFTIASYSDPNCTISLNSSSSSMQDDTCLSGTFISKLNTSSLPKDMSGTTSFDGSKCTGDGDVLRFETDGAGGCQRDMFNDSRSHRAVCHKIEHGMIFEYAQYHQMNCHGPPEPRDGYVVFSDICLPWGDSNDNQMMTVECVDKNVSDVAQAFAMVKMEFYFDEICANVSSRVGVSPDVNCLDINGRYVKSFCSGDHVFVMFYELSDCSGVPQNGHAYPVGNETCVDVSELFGRGGAGDNTYAIFTCMESFGETNYAEIHPNDAGCNTTRFYYDLTPPGCTDTESNGANFSNRYSCFHANNKTFGVKEVFGGFGCLAPYSMGISQEIGVCGYPGDLDVSYEMLSGGVGADVNETVSGNFTEGGEAQYRFYCDAAAQVVPFYTHFSISAYDGAEKIFGISYETEYCYEVVFPLAFPHDFSGADGNGESMYAQTSCGFTRIAHGMYENDTCRGPPLFVLFQDHGESIDAFEKGFDVQYDCHLSDPATNPAAYASMGDTDSCESDGTMVMGDLQGCYDTTWLFGQTMFTKPDCFYTVSDAHFVQMFHLEETCTYFPIMVQHFGESCAVPDYSYRRREVSGVFGGYFDFVCPDHGVVTHKNYVVQSTSMSTCVLGDPIGAKVLHESGICKPSLGWHGMYEMWKCGELSDGSDAVELRYYSDSDCAGEAEWIAMYMSGVCFDGNTITCEETVAPGEPYADLYFDAGCVEKTGTLELYSDSCFDTSILSGGRALGNGIEIHCLDATGGQLLILGIDLSASDCSSDFKGFVVVDPADSCVSFYAGETVWSEVYYDFVCPASTTVVDFPYVQISSYDDEECIDGGGVYETYPTSVCLDASHLFVDEGNYFVKFECGAGKESIYQFFVDDDECDTSDEFSLLMAELAPNGCHKGAFAGVLVECIAELDTNVPTFVQYRDAPCTAENMISVYNIGEDECFDGNMFSCFVTSNTSVLILYLGFDNLECSGSPAGLPFFPNVCHVFDNDEHETTDGPLIHAMGTCPTPSTRPDEYDFVVRTTYGRNGGSLCYASEETYTYVYPPETCVPFVNRYVQYFCGEDTLLEGIFFDEDCTIPILMFEYLANYDACQSEFYAPTKVGCTTDLSVIDTENVIWGVQYSDEGCTEGYEVMRRKFIEGCTPIGFLDFMIGTEFVKCEDDVFVYEKYDEERCEGNAVEEARIVRDVCSEISGGYWKVACPHRIAADTVDNDEEDDHIDELLGEGKTQGIFLMLVFVLALLV